MSTSISLPNVSNTPILRHVANLRQLLGQFPLSVVEVAMRVGVASVFWKSGLTKIANWDLTVQLFADEYNVPLLPPEVAAYLGTANELVCSIMVALGIAGRFGAAALLGMTLVIQTFVYPENWSEHLLWASILAYVVSRGPGVLSLDHIVANKLFGGR